MKYTEIDPIIYEWIQRHDLVLQTEYREEEVRSVEVVSKSGRRVCQIWIDSPDSLDHVGVHVWDMKKRRVDLKASGEELMTMLDRALLQAREWAAEDVEASL